MGTYGVVTQRVASVLAPAREPAPVRPDTNGVLTVLQTELFPATLWHSREPSVSCFAGLAASGLGAPTFLAYSSPTGIAVLPRGQSLEGSQLRESWLLVGFAGAEGWTEWDSPWAVYLQRRPVRVRLDEDGVRARFSGPVGWVALMPLYGYTKPPQKGHEFLSRHGLKERDLKTWEWATAVARDPLTRLRYWAGATRCFPVRSEDSVVVDRRRDTVSIREQFTYLDIPDEWGTRPIRLAPVSPTLGLALAVKGGFPVEFSQAPFDFEIATPYGPFFAVPNAGGYEMAFPVLRYVNETEAPGLPVPAEAPPVVTAALERLRAAARAKFPSADEYLHDHGGMNNFCWAIMGDQWYAKALPYYDDETRARAVASLRKYFREEVLVPDRFVTREFPQGSGRKFRILEGPGIGSWGVLGDAGKFSANLLETLWAYAHFTGDHALIRERWPLVRELFTTGAQTRWVGFGRDEIAELGDEAAPVLAYARLAYLAGDLEAYHYACGLFARELVHLFVKQRGAPWFRERQPWHSMEPMDEEVYLTNLWGDLAGWQIDGPSYPKETGERQFENRWVRFQDLDVARFYRDRLLPEVTGELRRLAERWDPRRRFTDDSHIMPSLVRLHSFLLDSPPAELAALASPEAFAGPPSGVIASCLAMLRTAGPTRWERLIPAAAPSAPVLGLVREVPGPNPYLVQAVQAGGAGRDEGWPRITWWGWKTPTGERWNFGEVRAGTNAVAPRFESRPASWNTVEIRATR